MTFGNQGEKVRQLQEKLAYLGFLDPSLVSGRYGDSTVDAVRDYQTYAGLRQNGIANISTQLKLNDEYAVRYQNDPAVWTVTDED
jgi:peptidoglycan hydrolase-like protein with peptidoglycan-binding domain